MSKVRYVPLYPDEWLAGTAELGEFDRGVYVTICALIYSRGGRIEEARLRGHCKAHGNAISASLARLEIAGKIVRKGSEIGQKRCENVLEKARKRSRNGSENVRHRWKSNSVALGVVSQGGNANQNLNQNKKEAGAKAPAKKAATRLPDDFAVPLDWLDAGTAMREKSSLPPADLVTEGVKFVNHWTSSGRNAAKLDWRRTWINWCLNAKGLRNGNAGAGSAESGLAKLAAWATADDEQEGLRGHH
jgi:uncharacterized protein YdaU (DUF1376 family)